MLRLIILLVTFIAAGPSYISSAQTTEAKPKKSVEPDDDMLRHYSREIGVLYRRLNIRSLNDIPEKSFVEYKKYVQNGTAYVIVHPAYYIFFHDYNDNKLVIERRSGNLLKNIVDVFIEDYPVGNNQMLQKMREGQNKEKDFLRKAVSQKGLVILVLPPNYINHHDYPYHKLDEFGRYLNEITKGAPSVVYIESRGHESGYLTGKTLSMLDSFLKETGVKTLLIGGGYVGLCVENFFTEAGRLHNIDKIELMPELLTSSPDFIMPGGNW